MKNIFAIATLLLSSLAAFAQPYPVSVRTTNGTSFGLGMQGTTTAANVIATNLFSRANGSTNALAGWGPNGNLTNAWKVGGTFQMADSTNTGASSAASYNSFAFSLRNSGSFNQTAALFDVGTPTFIFQGRSGTIGWNSGDVAFYSPAAGEVAIGTPTGLGGSFFGNLARFTNFVAYTTATATNGFASYSTTAGATIAASGWTNTFGINAGVYVSATAVSWIIKNRADATIYTSPTLTATVYVHLQPGWSVSSAAGLAGTALPE